MPEQQYRNIAQISRADASGGGAGRSAEKLTFLLNTQNGYKVDHWVGYPSQRQGPYTHCLHGGMTGRLMYRMCRLLSRKIGLPDFITPELATHLLNKNVEYDLYHLHDISATLSPLSINWLAKRKPVVWTLRDCSPFTGGCLYPMACQAWRTRCSHCPQLGTWPMLTRIDSTGSIQKYKHTIAHNRNIHAIAPSKWIADMAADSGMFNHRPVVIPNAVDQKKFKPFKKSTVRRGLNLPAHKFIILLASMNLNSKYKGTEYAFNALRELSHKVTVLIVGKVPAPDILKKALPGIRTIAPGYVDDDQLLSRYYASADLFLFPTLADNLPNVVLETMSCGTPTVAFATGGVPEMIDHNQNGWLARAKDTKGLIEGLKLTIQNPATLSRWREKGFDKIRHCFTHDILLKNHLALYNQTLQYRQA